MKRILLLVSIFILTIALSGCVEKEHEECITTWDYKVADKQVGVAPKNVYTEKLNALV